MKQVVIPSMPVFACIAILSAIITILLAVNITAFDHTCSEFYNAQVRSLALAYVPMFLGAAFLAGRAVWRKSRLIEVSAWLAAMVFTPIWGWHLYFWLWDLIASRI